MRASFAIAILLHSPAFAQNAQRAKSGNIKIIAGPAAATAGAVLLATSGSDSGCQRLSDDDKIVGLALIGGGGAPIFQGVRHKANPSARFGVMKGRKSIAGFYRKTWYRE